MQDIVFVPLLSELAPTGFFFGGHYVVEFDPDSLWYETSLTIAALALKQKIKTEYHVFQHFPNEALDALVRLGVDAQKAQEDGLLKMIDNYTETLRYEKSAKKPTGELDPFASGPRKPLDAARGAKNWADAARAGYSANQKRWLHLDDNTSIFLQYNDEKTLIDSWRIGQLPFGIRARETPHFLAFVKGIASDAFYTKFEAICDGVIDLVAEEEHGKINNYLRIRMLRGRSFDSSWHRLELQMDGPVALVGARSLEARKLSAVVFTDIVGFTSLNQSNETLALEVLEAHNRLLRPFFLKFNGREVKTIGDSFLVEFDSALEATRCAIEIQTALHDRNLLSRNGWNLKLRIGIHLGDVVHRDGDIFGDAVNIASRIQPVAEPEGICVSQQVFDQVHNKIGYPLQKLANPVLKNVRFETGVYQIVLPWHGRTSMVGEERTGRLSKEDA